MNDIDNNTQDKSYSTILEWILYFFLISGIVSIFRIIFQHITEGYYFTMVVRLLATIVSIYGCVLILNKRILGVFLFYAMLLFQVLYNAIIVVEDMDSIVMNAFVRGSAMALVLLISKNGYSGWSVLLDSRTESLKSLKDKLNFRKLTHDLPRDVKNMISNEKNHIEKGMTNKDVDSVANVNPHTSNKSIVSIIFGILLIIPSVVLMYVFIPMFLNLDAAIETGKRIRVLRELIGGDVISNFYYFLFLMMCVGIYLIIRKKSN